MKQTTYIVLYNEYSGPTSFVTKVDSIWTDADRAANAAGRREHSRIVPMEHSDAI